MKTVFSADRVYRYSLYREWEKEKGYVIFIGLNPSIADESKSDKTLDICINYAKEWGYGAVCIINLFAFITTYPTELKKAKDPIGPDNDMWLMTLAKGASLIVAAWGNDGVFKSRSKYIKQLNLDLTCLKINKSGEPHHPLYLPYNLKPISFNKL